MSFKLYIYIVLVCFLLLPDFKTNKDKQLDIDSGFSRCSKATGSGDSGKNAMLYMSSFYTCNQNAHAEEL